jgi:hypothetical protein
MKNTFFMKALQILVLGLLVFSENSYSQQQGLQPTVISSGIVFPEIVPKYKSKKLNDSDVVFLTNLLSSARMDSSLDCEIRAKDIRENRVFSTGSKWVEIIEVRYRGSLFQIGEVVANFPVGSEYKTRMTVSSSAGTVEEIVLKAEDSLEHQLLIQHDGRGHIVRAEMSNLNRLFPCRLKK